MKWNTVFATAVMAVVSTYAHASYAPPLKTPVLDFGSSIFTAKMSVTEAQYGFEGAYNVRLTLNKDPSLNRFDPPAVTLEYNQPSSDPLSGSPHHRTVILRVSRTETDTCGTVHYYADLSRTVDPDSRAVGARFHLHLADHSRRLCEDYKPFKWEADVREGFGWCGTGDATMGLQGNPKRVFGNLIEPVPSDFVTK